MARHWQASAQAYTCIFNMVSRRYFLFGSLALPLAAQKPQKRPAKVEKISKNKIQFQRPNMLLVLADNLPAWMTGCYGNKDVVTPNLDQLSKTGTRFLNSFVPAPAPIPSRNSFLTGRAFKAPDPAPAASILDQAMNAAGFGCGTATGATFSDTTAAAAKFLDQQSSGKSFALTVLYTGALEAPYDAVPEQYRDLYATQMFDSWAADPPARNAAKGKEYFVERLFMLRKVAGAVTYLDAEVGKLLVKLYDKQLLNDTLIIFASTCGQLLGRHGLWDSGDASDPPNMYEEVVNTPLIWSYPPRVPPSITQVGLVSAYDLMPTLCDFLLIDQPEGEFPGRSYALMATGKPFPRKDPWRTTVFAHYKNTEMARVDRYKVVVRDEGKGRGELYDLRVDHDEAQNQYENPQFEDIRNALSGQLANWRKFLV